MTEQGRGISRTGSAGYAATAFRRLSGLEDASYRKIWFWTAVVLLVCVVCQIVISADADNVACCALAFSGSLAVAILMIRAENMRLRPFSTWMVLLFGGANLAGPLLAKTLEFEPLTYNLSLPVVTFGYCVLGAAAFIVGHRVYAWFIPLSKFRRKITLKIMEPLGMFREPTVLQMWSMGAIGLAAMIYVYIFIPANVEASAGLLDKLVQSLIPFSYAPFLQVFSFMYSDRPKVSKSSALILGGYLIMILGLALARNSRAAFAIPLASGGLCLFIGVLCARLPRNVLRPRVVIPSLVVFLVLLPMITNLAIAMQLVRSSKGKVGGLELIQLSLAKYSDSQAIEDFLVNRSEGTTGWSETYVHNIILGRFIYTKFHDNGFALTRGLGESDRQKFSSFAFAHAFSFLPDPVISFFGIPLDKSKTITISEGDEIYYLATGAGLGSFRGASVLADGRFLFGNAFLLILVFASIPVYLLVDTLTIPLTARRPGEMVYEPSSVHREIRFSPAGLLNTFFLLNYTLSAGSMTDYIAFIFRGFPQLVLSYALVLYITSFMVPRRIRKARLLSANARDRATLRA